MRCSSKPVSWAAGRRSAIWVLSTRPATGRDHTMRFALLNGIGVRLNVAMLMHSTTWASCICLGKAFRAIPRKACDGCGSRPIKGKSRPSGY